MSVLWALLLAAPASGTACVPHAASGMVTRKAGFGGVVAPTVADADHAVEAARVAQRAARRHLGIDVPAFLIAATASANRPTDGCAFVFPWPFLRSASGNPLPSHILPHELGHMIFIRFVAPRTAADQYGGAAPDWLDEMAALACEDDAGIAMRRADTYRHAVRGTLIPLSRMLTMTHPEWSPGASPPDVTVSQPASPDTPAYYATVRAMFDFLIDRTGDPRIIRVLTEQARQKTDLGRWLITRLTRDGTRQDLVQLDADMRSFILHDAAYRTVTPSHTGPQG